MSTLPLLPRTSMGSPMRSAPLITATATVAKGILALYVMLLLSGEIQASGSLVAPPSLLRPFPYNSESYSLESTHQGHAVIDDQALERSTPSQTLLHARNERASELHAAHTWVETQHHTRRARRALRSLDLRSHGLMEATYHEQERSAARRVAERWQRTSQHRCAGDVDKSRTCHLNDLVYDTETKRFVYYAADNASHSIRSGSNVQ